MTKPHTPHGSGESLQKDLVTFIMNPLADLIEKARLEILGEIEHVEGLLDSMAGQMRRELDGNQGYFRGKRNDEAA